MYVTFLLNNAMPKCMPSSSCNELNAFITTFCENNTKLKFIFLVPKNVLIIKPKTILKDFM